MSNKLKPCIIFDLDDTLFYTPKLNWKQPEKGWEKTIREAKPIIPNVFLYHAVDYMVNDPPEGFENDPNWPKEIFFCTARPEFFREPTIQALCELTQDVGSSINKRLIMRPFTNHEDLSHEVINTPKEAKAWLLEQVKKKGYRPILAFDDSSQAVSAYLEGGVEVVHHTIASAKDIKKALKRYAV
jgi:hypothetical protein